MKQLQSQKVELLKENAILKEENLFLKKRNRELIHKLNRGCSNDLER